MESAALLRSFSCATSPVMSVVEKTGFIPVSNAAFPCFSGKIPVLGLASMGNLFSSTNKLGAMVVSCTKTAEASMVAKVGGDSNGAAVSDSSQKGFDVKTSLPRATFPDGIEALVHEFDETDIAELKLKIGDFEMLIKGKVEAPFIPSPAPPIPSSPLNEPDLATPLPTLKSSAEKSGSYTHVDAKISAQLAALEASGVTGYVLVPSPVVGSFLRCRTLKGKKQPPAVKEGDLIKVGQTIGFVNQLGTALPVRSDVAGEVLKVLYDDGAFERGHDILSDDLVPGVLFWIMTRCPEQGRHILLLLRNQCPR